MIFLRTVREGHPSACRVAHSKPTHPASSAVKQHASGRLFAVRNLTTVVNSRVVSSDAPGAADAMDPAAGPHVEVKFKFPI